MYLKTGKGVLVSLIVAVFFSMPLISLAAPALTYTSSGLPFSPLTVQGSGFEPGENISIMIGPRAMGSLTADGAGSFSSSFTVPNLATGRTYILLAIGSLDSFALNYLYTPKFYATASASSYYIAPGKTVSFSGSGFAVSETVDVFDKLAMASGPLSSITADSSGAFANSGSFTIPYYRTGSNWDLILKGRNSKTEVPVTLAVASLYATISPSSYYIQPGYKITISGKGFAANEPIVINMGDTAASVSADTLGSFTSSPVVVPFGVPGSIDVTAKGQVTGTLAAATIGIAPYYSYLVSSNYYATPGSKISFSGGGFAPSEDIFINVGSASIATLKTDIGGTVASNSVTVPFKTGDSAEFNFVGQLSKAAGLVKIGVAKFYSWLSLNNYYAPGGTSITANGAGFAPGEPISVEFDGFKFGSASTDSLGSFSLTARVPFAAEGLKAVKAIGQWSGAIGQTTFTQAPVYASVWLGAYASGPGTAITFIGSGYLPNEPIEIRTDRTGTSVAHSFTADSSGNLNNSGYIIPADFTEGTLELKVNGLHGMIEKKIIYYVTGK